MQAIGTRPLHKLSPSFSDPLLASVRMYIYALPFTYAISMADGRVTISLLTSLWLVALLISRLLRHNLVIPSLMEAFYLFLAFVSLLPLSQLFTGTVSDKSLNHLLAYSVSIVGFGLIPMLAVANMSRQGWAEVLIRDIMWTARLAALIAVLQFIGSNFLDFFSEDLIYYPDTIEAKSMFFGIFFRSRGFAAEPGHYAFTLELLAPLLLYGHSFRQKKSSLIMVTDLLLMLLAFLSVGSPVGLLILGAGFLLAVLLFPTRHVTPFLWFGLIALAIALGLVEIVGNQADQLNRFDLLSSLFIDKLDSTSATDRADRINVGLKLIYEASPLQLLLGYGPAVYVSQKLGEQTIIQFYLLLFLEGGALGMLLFLSGFAFMVAQAIRQLGPGRVFYFWVLINLTLHYFFISNYYYPMIWFMFPLLLIMQSAQKSR